MSTRVSPAFSSLTAWLGRTGVEALGIAAVISLYGAAAVSAQEVRFAASEGPDDAPTYASDVAAILNQNCVSCHREGAIGPMSLQTYSEVRPWASVIKLRVEERTMPPWHLNKSVGIQDYANDISLTEKEIQTISRWVAAGTPAGDLSKAPPPPDLPKPGVWGLEEELGPPDMIVRSQPYTVIANGQDQFTEHATEWPGLEEPRYLKAAEFRPSSRLGHQVLHHGHASIRVNGDATRNAKLGSYGIGRGWERLPEGGGMKIPAGPAEVSWNLHYFPVGEAVEDEVAQVGLWFHPAGYVPEIETGIEEMFRIDRTHTTGLMGRELLVPPHGKLILNGTHVLDTPAIIESFRPHMHMRGSEMTMEAVYPDGRRELLSHVDKFSNQWHIAYEYAEHARPLLPKGTVLLFKSVIDNTEGNPNNPDPDQWVTWGDRGADDMSHAWIRITYLSQEQYDKIRTDRERQLVSTSANITVGR